MQVQHIPDLKVSSVAPQFSHKKQVCYEYTLSPVNSGTTLSILEFAGYRVKLLSIDTKVCIDFSTASIELRRNDSTSTC